MTKMSVRLGALAPPAAEALKAPTPKPMRWATRNPTGLAVFICDLRRDETGLACDCICPACGSPLQAVNAGVGAEHFLRANTRGQFFRHATGHQRDDCLILIARLAALQLLVNRQEIDLPPPKRTAYIQGVSGEVYPGEALGRPQRLLVREHTWIDTQHASITLDDDRIVLLRLDTSASAHYEAGYDGIITITVDDPEVASWDVAEILARMKLGEIPTCWDKHWDDESLNALANADAESKAADHLDYLFPALGDLEGLTQAQRSESILHYAIKRILLNARVLASPKFREPLNRVMPNGVEIPQEVVLALGELRLSDATAERAFGNIVADVFCRALAPGAASFDLAIEVAVTHRVDAEKSKRITALNVACLEIDVRGFLQRGRVTLDAVRKEVLHNPDNKRWVHHPLIAAARAEANRALDDLERSMLEAAERARRAREWLDTLTLPQLLSAFHQGLIPYWHGSPPALIAGHTIELTDLASRLVKMGLVGADKVPFPSKQGVLHFLHLAKSYSGQAVPRELSLADMCSVIGQSVEYRSLITYLLIGLRIYNPLLPTHQAAELKEIRSHVRKSLERGESTFARSCSFDPLVIAMFPELAEPLAADFGTQERANKDRKKWMDEEIRRATAERAHDTTRKDGDASEQYRQDLARAINDSSRYSWEDKLGFASDVDQIMALHDMKVACKRFLAHGCDARTVVSSAWDAREQRIQFTVWLKTQPLSSIHDMNACMKLLETAWMIKKR